MIEQLNDWQPEVLIAYASMTGTLAEEQLAGRLRIHPQVVYAASEVLTQPTRQRAREAWGNEPFNQYAATETANIASEYRGDRRMHFFEDLVIAENVDEYYRPVPSGEYGAKVLITTLFSRTQPLIRYELNDSVRVSTEPNESGLPFAMLDGIQGRVEDALHLPAIASGQIAVQPLVFNRVMDIVPVGGWQVTQQADDGLVLLLTSVRDGLTDEALVDLLTRSLTQEGVRVPYLHVQRVAAIPKTAAGKAPLIKAYRPAALA
jgi:phenylacetate-coenzyme A ligase PaaK-like adenylate-forming protein